MRDIDGFAGLKNRSGNADIVGKAYLRCRQSLAYSGIQFAGLIIIKKKFVPLHPFRLYTEGRLNQKRNFEVFLMV